MNLRISVSRLETFRKFLDGEMKGYFTQQLIIDDIKGLRPYSAKANLGTAFHALLEMDLKSVKYLHDPIAEKGKYIIKTKDMQEPVTFSNKQAAKALWFREQHPDIVHEVPVKTEIELRGHSITISGRMDGMEGFIGSDAKTSDKASCCEDWENSFQWKYYAWMAKLRQFRYDIFQFVYKDQQLDNVIYHAYNFLPYMGMQEECLQLLDRYLDFCSMHNLNKYLIDRYHPDPVVPPYE